GRKGSTLFAHQTPLYGEHSRPKWVSGISRPLQTPRKPDLNHLLTHLAHAFDQPDVLGRVALQGQPCLEKARTGILLRPLTSHVHIHLTHFALAVTHMHAQLQLG